MSTTSDAIQNYLSANLDAFIQETIALCAQPSVSATGLGVRNCATLVRRMLECHGFEVDWFETPGNPILVGRARGRSHKMLLFYNHYDVQPPEPLESWTSPPFEPTVRDGALFARGVADDKGEFVARLAAVEAVRAAHGGELPCGVTFVLEGEEEIGSPNIAPFALEHLDILRSQAAIWEVGGVGYDGAPGTTLGARGILAVELSVQTLARDAHSGGAHSLPSSAWRLVWALNSLKDRQEKILIRGWYDHVVPPFQMDLDYLERLPDFEAQSRQELGLEQFLNGLTGMDLKKAVFDPTCNIQGITTGYQGPGVKTIVPARASAKLDFRLVPRQDPDVLFGLLRAHLDAHGFSDVTVTRLGSMHPYKASADDPFIRLAERLAPEVYGLPLQVTPLSGGSSPMYAFAGPLGNIPVLWAGVGGPNSRAHSPNECIELKNFASGALYLARILDEFADSLLNN